MTQPNYVPSIPARGFLINARWPWSPFYAYPVPCGPNSEPRYTWPGCKQYTAQELFFLCSRKGWPIREALIS